jgi:hypothetical protein
VHLARRDDDATSELLALRFEPTETTSGYFALLREYFQRIGRPLSFCTDKPAIFRKTVESPTEEKTQFGHALDELDVAATTTVYHPDV